MKNTFNLKNPFNIDIKNNGGVYFIENDFDDTVYVGSTHNFFERLEVHKRRARQAYHNSPLYEAIREHGIEHFTFYVFHIQNDSDLRIKHENYLISETRRYKPLYNVVMKAYHARKMTPELHNKLSMSHKKGMERKFNPTTGLFEESRKNA